MKSTYHLFLFLWLSATWATGQTRWYVKADATGSQTGLSWTTAFSDLQQALALAEYGDEIWLAEGIYYPTQDANEDTSFTLPSGVKLYGGFAGDEQFLWQRDWEAHESILSGDIGTPGELTDNSKTILYAKDVDSTTLLDGLVFEMGYADSTRTGSSINHKRRSFSGGALVFEGKNASGVPTLTIKNCVFRQNYAAVVGGAIAAYSLDYLNNYYLQLRIDNCTFTSNRTDTIAGDPITVNGGTIGGAIFFHGTVVDSIWVRNSRFYDNFSYGEAAACYYALSPPQDTSSLPAIVFDSCVFEGNSQSGIFNLNLDYDKTPIATIVLRSSFAEFGSLRAQIKNTRFTENLALGAGDVGIVTYGYPKWKVDFSVENCTFEGSAQDKVFIYMPFTKNFQLSVGVDINLHIRNSYFNNGGGGYHLVFNETGKIVCENSLFRGGHILSRTLPMPSDTEDWPLNASFVNNTLLDGQGTPFVINGDIVDSTSVHLYNNILLGNFSSVFGSENNTPISEKPGLILSHNLLGIADSSAIAPDYWPVDLGPGMLYGYTAAQAGITDLFSSGNYSLDPCSPAINSGDPGWWPSPLSTDLAGKPRMLDGNVDLGALEADTIELSLLSSWDAACPSAHNGGVIFSAENYCDQGTPGYQISWPGGSHSGLEIQGLSPGSYTFTFTDALGRTAQTSAEIGVDNNYALDLEVSLVPTLPGTAQGQILILDIQGGTAPYSLLWNDGDTSWFHTGLEAGWHEVQISDAMGCSFIQAWEVPIYTAVQEPLPLNPSAHVFPNPGTETFVMALQQPAPYPIQCALYSPSGTLVAHSLWPEGYKQYELTLPPALPPGIYFWKLKTSDNQTVAAGKWILVK